MFRQVGRATAVRTFHFVRGREREQRHEEEGEPILSLDDALSRIHAADATREVDDREDDGARARTEEEKHATTLGSHVECNQALRLWCGLWWGRAPCAEGGAGRPALRVEPGALRSGWSSWCAEGGAGAGCVCPIGSCVPVRMGTRDPNGHNRAAGLLREQLGVVQGGDIRMRPQSTLERILAVGAEDRVGRIDADAGRGESLRQR